MAEIPPLLPFPFTNVDLTDGPWTVPEMPSSLRPIERREEALNRYFSSYLKLQRTEFKLLEDLDKASRDGKPLTVYVEGFDPDVELMFALMRCAYQFQVAITFDPRPVPDASELSTSGPQSKLTREK